MITQDIPAEVVERMVALVRLLVEDVSQIPEPASFSARTVCTAAYEARAIVALLPKPVDPDLIEARSLLAGWLGDLKKYPSSEVEDLLVAAIRHGRELGAAS